MSIVRLSFQGVIRPTLVMGLLILALIQFLQPHFFLTSDNMCQLFPVWTEVGRHLARGENPWISQYLYGGTYPLYKDPTFLSCFHPAVLTISLLANTPLRFFLIDIFASLQILGSSLALAGLLLTLMQRKLARLAPWQAVTLSLSYGFSGYNLIVGSSWFFYVANQTALPLYFTGLLMKKRPSGIALIALGGVHAFLSGVPSSYLFTLLVATWIIALQSLGMRSPELIIRWILGQAATAILISPILYFSITGFLEADRNTLVASAVGDLFNVPLFSLAAGWFMGSLGALFAPEFSLINTSSGLGFILFTSACAWWLPTCFFLPRPALAASAWEKSVLAGVALSLLLIVRPAWVTEILNHLPFFRSTRWPFREIFILVFLLHLAMAFRIGSLSQRVLVHLLIPGVIFLAASLVFFYPAVFLFNGLDRDLLLSGRAEKYWQNIREQTPSATLLIPVQDPNQFGRHEKSIPLTLLGACNYPSFFRVKSITGYSSTPPASALPLKNVFSHSRFLVFPDELPALQKEAIVPTATCHLETLHPLRVVWESPTQRFSITLPP